MWLGQVLRDVQNQGCTQDLSYSKAETEHHCLITEDLLFVVPEEIPLFFCGTTLILFQLNGSAKNSPTQHRMTT